MHIAEDPSKRCKNDLLIIRIKPNIIVDQNNMSADQFEKNYRECQERIERLRNQVEEISNARPGQSVASQKYLMKATWATL